MEDNPIIRELAAASGHSTTTILNLMIEGHERASVSLADESRFALANRFEPPRSLQDQSWCVVFAASTSEKDERNVLLERLSLSCLDAGAEDLLSKAVKVPGIRFDLPSAHYPPPLPWCGREMPCERV